MIFQIFNQITPPETNISISPDPTDAVVTLLSFILRLVFFAAGLFGFWNFVSAGFKLMNSAGDAKALDAARGKFIWTFIGFLVMVSAVVVAGIIGITVYGDWNAIIDPQFETP